MAVRELDGSDDAIILLPGSLGSPIPAPGGPYTLALLVKRVVEIQENGIVSIGPAYSATSASFGNGKLTFWIGNTTSTGIKSISTAGDATSTLLWTVADGWTLLVATKAAGSAIPRLHKYVLGTNVMTRANASGALGSVALDTADRIAIGKDEYTGKPQSRWASMGYWNALFSDAMVDELIANRRTRDWYDHSAGKPMGLWDFNQAAVGTAVTDLTGGGADQTAIVGTTVVSGDDPPGWEFGIGSRQLLRPSADLATTGWTATPLHSKLSDQSDATVMTATLA